MAVYQLYREQRLKTNLEEIWDFISSPRNLKKITPEYMGFDITTPDLPEKMYPGMIISYKVSPFLGIKMTWVTEITHVRDKSYFVDEQRVGPYTMWHHEHFIEEIPGGILMKDLITYKPPFGILGDLSRILFIQKQLDEIFEFRRKVMEERYGEI